MDTGQALAEIIQLAVRARDMWADINPLSAAAADAVAVGAALDVSVEPPTKEAPVKGRLGSSIEFDLTQEQIDKINADFNAIIQELQNAVAGLQV